MEYVKIGRFEKLNDDIRHLALKLLEDQDLCKLIHYPDNNPLDQPDVNGIREVLDKRLLLFVPRLPQAKETGTFVTIMPVPIRPTRSGNLIASTLRFDVYSHHETRAITYQGADNKVRKNVDRVLLIMDKIQNIISGLHMGIGQDQFQGADYVGTNNATFSGYQMIYNNIDFESIGFESLSR